MDNIQEEYILEQLKQNNIWFKLMGRRYSGNDQYHNWYVVGINENKIFGEIEFSKNPIWRLSWYKNGKTHHDTGFVLSNFNKFLKVFITLSIPGSKQKIVDEKLKEIEDEFN